MKAHNYVGQEEGGGSLSLEKDKMVQVKGQSPIEHMSDSNDLPFIYYVSNGRVTMEFKNRRKG